MKSYLFPGQGVQHVGMGRDLFARFARELAAADAILGCSVESLCLRDEGKRLANTLYAQPAIHVVNCLSYLKQRDEDGAAPDIVAGHSLGELAALFAAGVFDFEESVRIVKKRAELMAMANGGGMIAVLGLSEAAVRDVLQRQGLDSIDIANLNTPSQCVLSGLKQDISNAARHFEQAGATGVIPLNVSGAFHSRYMSEAAREFKTFLSAFSPRIGQVGVLSNVTAQLYEEGQVIDLLTRQIVSPVRWCESVQRLLGFSSIELVPVGPGTVIAGLITKIRNEAQPLEPPALRQPRRTEPAIVAPAPAANTCEAPRPSQEPSRLRSPVVPPEPVIKLLPCLGSPEFCNEYGVRLAYVAGAMYKGIASVDLVVRMANAGLLSFYGSGGQALAEIEQAILDIKRRIRPESPFGMNLLASPNNPSLEHATVQLYLRHGIRIVEAAAYTQITPSLVLYRLRGLKREKGGKGAIVREHRVFAKVSHPSVAEAFLSPAPESLIQQLLNAGEISTEQAALGRQVPMADELCAEADSAGHTDRRTPLALLSSMLALRDRIVAARAYAQPVRVGAAGGIGTPASVMAAFVMGSDFVLTGSINQCTVEAGTSDIVKDMLAAIDINDTTTCPSGDYFESGAQIQVLKKGLFFPMRAQRLYELYQRHASLDELDAPTRAQLEEKYFGRSIDEVYEETRRHYLKVDPEQIGQAERNPRHKMALVFRWYFIHTSRLARQGERQQRVNFQVHCGPALGAFNQWIKGTALEDWRKRHVDELADLLMNQASELFDRQARIWLARYPTPARAAEVAA